MTSFTTPARIRWARSNFSGQVPETLAPGSMAVNWPDRKVFVGDAGAQAVQFSQWLDDFNATLTYKADDFCLYQGDIWRCLLNTTAGVPFDTDQWDRLTNSRSERLTERASSNILSGGEVTLIDDTTVDVTAGEALITYFENGGDLEPIVTFVTWGSFTATVAPVAPGDTYATLYINQTGTIGLSNLFTPSLRRETASLATLFFVSDLLVEVDDASAQTGRISEAIWDEYVISGGAYKISDATLRASTTDPLGLLLGRGRYYSLGRLWRSQPKTPNLTASGPFDPLPFTQMTRLGDPRDTAVTAIDPNSYDAAGVITPVPAGQWTIQYLYTKAEADTFYIQYGQLLYATLEDAADNIRNDYAILRKYFDEESSIVVGAVIIQQGTTDLVDAEIVNIIGSGANPFEPVITTSVNANQYYLIDGSRVLTGDMDAAGNTIDDAVIDGGQMV